METLFTVSGVVTCVREDVWRQIGGWSENIIIDDIDISRKIQLHGYKITYELRTLCRVLVPEAIRGLCKQRLHWAQGDAEAILKYSREVWYLKNIHLWPLYFEYAVAPIWAYLLFTFFFVSITQAIDGTVDPTPSKLGSLATSIVFLIRLSVSIYIDGRYEGRLLRYFTSYIRYPYAFWMTNSLAPVHGSPKALLRGKNRKATWTSPDRSTQQPPLIH